MPLEFLIIQCKGIHNVKKYRHISVFYFVLRGWRIKADYCIGDNIQFLVFHLALNKTLKKLYVTMVMLVKAYDGQ